MPLPIRIIARVEKNKFEIEIIARFTVMKSPLNRINLLSRTALAAAFQKWPRRSRIALAALIAIAVLVAVMYAGWMVKRRADRELDAARALSEARGFAAFEKDTQRAFTGGGVELIQNIRGARSLAQFNDSVFAATGGGLIEFDEEGKTKRRYTALDGLPESDLTSVAVFNSKLFIGSN
jgi:hypothetical protein